MATSFYADTYTDIDGRDAIASVDVYTKSDQEGGSVNQQVTGIIKGIVINNENLNHSCCPKCTCCSDFRDVLLLPVCSIKLYDKTKIDKIVAEVYGFTNPLDVSKPDKIIQKYNHQLIPCNRKDDKNKKSVNNKKDDKSKKSIKSVSAQILTRDELLTCVRYSPKKLFAVRRCGGRQTFVQLRVVDDNNTGQIKFEKSQSDEILSTYGPLVLGIRKIKKNGTDEYDVDAIGSYSQEDSGIIITLFGDVNQTNTSADGSKASNGQNAAMNTDSVPSGSMLSDSSQLEDKQAHNTNKPGAVATNCELNITVVNAENYPLALENGEGEEFLNEDKGEGGVVPNKNTGKNNVKPAAAEQKALDDEKPSSVQEGLVPISKKGKNPVKPAATGGLLTVRTKFPSSQSADESFANPDDISSDRGTLQLAPYASRSAEILNSEAPMPEKISRLNRLKESPPIEYYELVKQETQTQLIFEKLSKGIEYLSNEFMEDEKLIKENLRENQSGQEIKKAIKRNTLRQEIVNDLKKSLALAQTLKNVYEICIQVLEERILDKETIEKLREELDGTKTKLHKLEKEKGSSQQQAKNEAQGPHDSIESLQEKEMAKIQALMLKSISCPEQTTLTELEEKMKQFISLSKKRCDNFRKRSSESSDDDSPDASSNR